MGKRGIVSDFLPWLLIAIAVLVIIMVGIFIMKGKGIEFIDRINDLFRGR
jgi:hypothetical protein